MNDYVADPRRILLGAIAAPIVPSLAAQIPIVNFVDFWVLAIFGIFSVITLYLPLILWRLPRTHQPFLICVILGGLSAPGLLGYSFATIAGLYVATPAAPIILMVFLFPVGAIGGAVFWLCAVWRSEGSEQPV